jgi:hypothetical protein
MRARRWAANPVARARAASCEGPANWGGTLHPAWCEGAGADWPAHSGVPDGSVRHPVRSPATPAAKHRFNQSASLLPESGINSIDDARRGSCPITHPGGRDLPDAQRRLQGDRCDITRSRYTFAQRSGRLPDSVLPMVQKDARRLADFYQPTRREGSPAAEQADG